MSVWAESLKTLGESSIHPLSGTGGITQKVNMLGMQDREACPAFTVHVWTAQTQKGRGSSPMGRGGQP